jgi:hypothetical protein
MRVVVNQAWTEAEERVVADSWKRAKRQASLVCFTAFASAVMAASLCVTAMVVQVPVAVAPVVAIVCVCLPVFGSWELADAVRVLRGNGRARAIARFRRGLDRLPETDHPLGY